MTRYVWIIIVNYRTADLTINCLNSISIQITESPTIRTVVVDNNSGDGSIELLTNYIDQAGWENWASVLALNKNGGFAFGNNAGIKEALKSDLGADYFMLLNPDTIVHKGSIRELVDFMDSNDRAGICGSLLKNSGGGSECSAHNAFTPLGELESGARLGILSHVLRRYTTTLPIQETPHQCEWVSGASLMIRREVIELIGMLDEDYFLYFEEADFCLRARKENWQIWLVPQSQVTHLEGAATGIKSVLRRRPSYWYASRRRYFVKHFGIVGLIFADLLWALGRTSLFVRRVLRLGTGGQQQDPKWFAFDLLWGDLKSLFIPSNARK